jgi:RES domain-containing protein
VTPLPAALGGTELVAWRLDAKEHEATWDSGEGSFRHGGRWNSPGVRAVYCALDPATAILEVAVHKGFEVLDTQPHVLTGITISQRDRIEVVDATKVANPNWLVPGYPSAGQQNFGNHLLTEHKFVVIPSAVSTHSWNLIFVATTAAGAYTWEQHRFALDTRLHPPAVLTRTGARRAADPRAGAPGGVRG